MDRFLQNKLFHNHINKKCSVDSKTELFFVLKCFYGSKTAKFAVESKHFLKPVHFEPKIYLILYP